MLYDPTQDYFGGVMSRKKRSSSQRKWLKRQLADPYVKKANELGYPSRAVFKLMEIQEKERLFKKGMSILDLGAAPGSWSKVVSEWVGDDGSVYSLDILPMQEIPGVHFIQGDFTDENVYLELLRVLEGTQLDLVISDMAPNMSGIRTVDQPKSMLLVEMAFDICKKVLKQEGAFIVKVFQGEGFEAFLRQVKAHFSTVKLRKPVSSRAASREQYLIAKGFHLS